MKKTIVETTIARIDQYKNAINYPELWENEFVQESKELGMPGAPLRDTSSPVERIITKKELTVEILKEWIRQDESRIFMYKLEIEQLEKALEVLTSQEKYIIECKYFNNMFWRDIELSINNNIRQTNYVTQGRLKQINKEAIDKLRIILEPFYAQFRAI